MSELVHQTQENIQPVKSGRSRKKTAPEPVKLKPVSVTPVDAIAPTTIVDAVVQVADVELVQAQQAYAQRTTENMGRLSEFMRGVQGACVAAVRQNIEEVYGDVGSEGAD